MISPSPEFPVTKVGMVNRRRGKPLRTYGRQPLTNVEAPAAKKRKTTHEPSPLSKTSETSEHIEEKERQDTSDGTIVTAKGGLESTSKLAVVNAEPTQKKGSILSFFKPLPPKPIAEKLVTKEGIREDEDLEPSKPSPKRQKRASRLLRLRSSLPTEDPSGVKENQDPSGEEKSTIAVDHPLPQSSKPKAAPSIQTTLNISSRATFEECKLCNTVWNPSFADDVKYHKRRHAAVLRRRQSDTATEGLR